MLEFRILRERLRGRLALHWLLFRGDIKYRLAALVTLASIAVTVLSATPTSLFGFILSMISFALTLFRKNSLVLPPERNEKLAAREVKTIEIEENPSLSFFDISPPKSEREMGFRHLVSSPQDRSWVTCAALSSEDFNNRLMLSERIPWSYGEDLRGSFLLKDTAQRQDQLRYLIARVRDQSISTNDPSVSLSTKLTALLKEAKLSRITYFDHLLTDEAFRSEVVYARKNSLQVRPVANPSVSFPVAFESNNNGSRPCLQEHPIATAAGIIGVTTLAITADKFPIIFEQLFLNTYGGGALTAGGSGAMIYPDIRNANSDDLKGIVAFSMAREICQEATLRPNNEKALTDEYVSEIAKTTIVTGFFRWVDRGGMPEFIGATRLAVARSKVKANEVEVCELKKPIRTTVQRLEDFSSVLKELRDQKLLISTSSFAAITRLVEIGSYRESNDPEKKEIFSRVTTALGLE